MLFRKLDLRRSREAPEAEPSGSLGNPDLEPFEVSSQKIDFGDVWTGGTKTERLTIRNNSAGTIVTAILDSPDSIFSLPQGNKSFTLLIKPGQSQDLSITFEPSDEGRAKSQLSLYDTLMEKQGTVALNGSGTPPPPSPEIEALLEFFDKAVTNGKLEGRGSARSTKGRLEAMRNMIEEVSATIEAGDSELALKLLAEAYDRTNGNETPVDLVQGPAAQELAGRISDLLEKGL